MPEKSEIYAKYQRCSSNEERGEDLYETPEIATVKLIDNALINAHTIWEPCCGFGAISEILYSKGFSVINSDKTVWTPIISDAPVLKQDFLLTTQKLANTIITNPPYKSSLPAKMLEHAFDINVEQVFFLLRLAFLEGKSGLRRKILDGGYLKNVMVFAERIPRMHRHNWAGKIATSTTAFAWFEFTKKRNHEARITRI